MNAGAADRIGELDVLRGFALLGVFIVHFATSAFWNLPLDPAIADQWRAEPLQRGVMILSDILFLDKANTLFATLFGMGFWVMMERIRARGGRFERLYLRRLFVLLLIGSINIFLVFPGDVLHEYALIGFLLFALRGLSPRAMLLLGLLFTLGVSPALHWWLEVRGPDPSNFSAIQAEAFDHGGYIHWVWTTGLAHIDRDIAHLGLVGWASYVFGRFLLGAWIIRKGWIQRSATMIPLLRRIALVALPAGLGFEGGFVLIEEGFWTAPVGLAEALHLFGAPLTALGYALLLICIYHRRRSAMVQLFAPVGRVALSAYVAHAAIFTLVFMPFGLNLLNVISPAVGLMIALILFSGMTLAATSWLRAYHYGPLEYLWRWGTYGVRPKFRLQSARANVSRSS